MMFVVKTDLALFSNRNFSVTALYILENENDALRVRVVYLLLIFIEVNLQRASPIHD